MLLCQKQFFSLLSHDIIHVVAAILFRFTVLHSCVQDGGGWTRRNNYSTSTNSIPSKESCTSQKQSYINLERDLNGYNHFKMKTCLQTNV